MPVYKLTSLARRGRGPKATGMALARSLVRRAAKTVGARTVGRKFRRRRVRRGRGRERFPRAFGAVPTHKNVKVKWGYSWIDNEVTYNSQTDWVFRPNNPTDPYVGYNGARQPRYFDQWIGSTGTKAMYQNYIVYAAKYKIIIQNMGNVPLVGALTMYANVADNRPTTYQEAIERGDCRTFNLAPLSAGGRIALSQYISIKKLVQASDLLDDPANWGTNSTGPTNASYSLRIWNLHAVASMTTAVSVSLGCVYYCRFFNKNDVTDSIAGPGVDDDEIEPAPTGLFGIPFQEWTPTEPTPASVVVTSMPPVQLQVST